jgi:hypothetical protein
MHSLKTIGTIGFKTQSVNLKREPKALNPEPCRETQTLNQATKPA